MKRKTLNDFDKEAPKTCIAYLRVSSKEQVENFSLGNQSEVCKRYIEHAGLKLLTEPFRDEGESAKNSDRPALIELLQYAEKNKGKIGYLVIPRLDRLNRNIGEFYMLKNRLEKLGIAIVSASEGIGQNAEGVLLEAVIAGVAQFDNITRSRKTIEGMKARVLSGYWTSSAPVGYLNGLDADKKNNLLPDPDKAPFIRLLFEDYARGIFTFKELADKYKEKFWSKRNVPMYKQRVASILKNPVYCGRIEKPDWDISVKAKFPALIPEELFYKVQDILNGHAASRKMPRTRLNDDFPLRGIRCGVCGHRMTGGWNTGKMKNKKYGYYSCINRTCSSQKSAKKNVLEDSFSAFLEENAPSEEFFVALKEAVRLSYNSEMDEAMEHNKELEKKLEQLKLDKENILGLMVREPLLVEDLKEQLTKRTQEIKIVEAAVKNNESEDFDLGSTLEFAIELMRNLHLEWPGFSAKELGVLIKILFPQNLRYHYPNIKTPELPIIYKLNLAFAQKKKHIGCLMGIGPT